MYYKCAYSSDFYDSSLLIYAKATDFLCIGVVYHNITILNSTNKLLVESLRFYVFTCIVTTLLHPFWLDLFISFSCLIAFAVSSSTTLLFFQFAYGIFFTKVLILTYEKDVI